MTPAQRKEKREDRKRRRVCVQCEAGLQENDAILCVECCEAREASRARYDAKNPNRKRSGKRKRWYDDPAKRRADYASKKVSGETCVRRGCPRPPAQDSSLCEQCRDAGRIASREYSRRKTGYYERRSVVVGTELAAPSDAQGLQAVRLYLPDPLAREVHDHADVFEGETSAIRDIERA